MEIQIYSRGYTGSVKFSMESHIYIRGYKSYVESSKRTSMESHINARGCTGSVEVQHGTTHSHKRIYKLCLSPAWKHAFTHEDIQAPRESSMETHIHTRGYSGVSHGSPA